MSLLWRHNGRDSVSNHQPHHLLLNRLFRRRSEKTSKLRVTGLCVGNSPVTGEYPVWMASNAENVSIWWRHQSLVLSHQYDMIGNIPYYAAATKIEHVSNFELSPKGPYLALMSELWGVMTILSRAIPGYALYFCDKIMILRTSSPLRTEKNQKCRWQRWSLPHSQIWCNLVDVATSRLQHYISKIHECHKYFLSGNFELCDEDCLFWVSVTMMMIMITIAVSIKVTVMMMRTEIMMATVKIVVIIIIICT